MSDRDFSNLIPGADRPRGRRGQRRPGERPPQEHSPESEPTAAPAETSGTPVEPEHERGTAPDVDKETQKTAGDRDATRAPGSVEDEGHREEAGESYRSSPAQQTDGSGTGERLDAATPASEQAAYAEDTGTATQPEASAEAQAPRQPSPMPTPASAGRPDSKNRGTSGSGRELPEGKRSPMASREEQVIPSHYTLPESHTIVVDEIRAILRRPPYRYTKRQASQSNVVALAIERLYEDLTGEHMPRYGSEQDERSGN